MPEALSTLATVISLFTVVNYVQDENVDVYLNGQQVAQKLEQRRQDRRDDIINQAIERQQEILLANQRVISQTKL